MNVKKTALLALVLACAVLYLTQVALPRKEREALKNAVLGTTQSEQLTQIEVSRLESGAAEVRQQYSLRKGGSNGSDASAQEWYVAGRSNIALDKSAVSSFLGGLQSLTVSDPIKDTDLGKDFSVYGLDKPSLTISVEAPGDAQGQRVEVAFGKKNEYLGARYAKVSGRSGVFLVEEGAFSAVNKGLSDLRTHNPIVVNDDDVKSIVVASANGTVTVQRSEGGAWRITDPLNRPASSLAVKTLLDSLRALRATDFIDDVSKSKAYGLEVPKASVKLFFGEDKVPTHREVKVGLSSVDGSMAAYFSFNNSPSIFKAASADLSPFILTADSFRDRALMPVTLDEIQSIKASGSKVDPVEILATEKDWTVNGKRSDPVFAEQYLTDLTSLQIAEFPTKGGEHAFDNPFLTLVVTKKGEQKEQVTLVIGDEVITRSGTRRFARIGTDGEPVLITDLDAKRIVPHEEALVEAATPTPAVTSREAAPQRDPHDAGASKP